MSQEFNGSYQNYLNLSSQRDWIHQGNMVRVQPPLQEDPPPEYDAAEGILTMNYPWDCKDTNNDVLISQIHSNHGWSHKNRTQAELALMNTTKVSSLPHLRESYINSIDPQFTWGFSGSNLVEHEGINRIGNLIESEGLSLSLSSKFEDLKMRNGTSGIYSLMNEEIVSLNNNHIDHQEVIHVGYPASQSLGLLRHSRYVKAAQELLDEFCCVGKGNFKNSTNRRVKRDDDENPNDNGSESSSSLKEQQPSLSASGRSDYQRRKAKLISMLDEVVARYARYCEQMQAMESSFDTVLFYSAATTYTTLARKAMSRHFRCLKDAIVAQLKLACELLGDKDLNTLTGLTKGETPRLRLLEKKYRQQKSLQQIGMVDSEAWRPQRGLPERSVNVLRAWLFEHFLHPYPSEADKHLLSRQTGLSKNQVSNWFINARVRLWKPMIEDIYQQETRSKDNEQETSQHFLHEDKETKSQEHQIVVTHVTAQTSMHDESRTCLINDNTGTKIPVASSLILASGGRRTEMNAIESDPSQSTINFSHCTTLGNQQEILAQVGNTNVASPFVSFSNTQGGCDQVSLSLGLKYSSDNIQRKNHLSFK
ncbi:hypothetical protein Leryth_014564 [Lithospermum erythrorhizon]|nr:hypothetical protein Leryth_014564 [Lithospermum erythrorhizon]